VNGTEGGREVLLAASTGFVADAMVGKLARWLRLTGADVLYNASWDDPELLAIARSGGRVLLTRDVPLASGSGEPRRLLVESNDFREQLVQVVTACGLDPWKRLFTRCMDCNSPLRPALREEARHKAPPYVFSTQDGFKWCPQCDKILWHGTHSHEILTLLGELFPVLGRREVDGRPGGYSVR
jgi:uncharacterized protein with PIN domain